MYCFISWQADCFFAMTLLASSLLSSILVCAVTTGLQVSSYFLIWRHYINEENSAELTDRLTLIGTVGFFIGIVYFIILQKRELKQFFNQEDLKKK